MMTTDLIPGNAYTPSRRMKCYDIDNYVQIVQRSSWAAFTSHRWDDLDLKPRVARSPQHAIDPGAMVLYIGKQDRPCYCDYQPSAEIAGARPYVVPYEKTAQMYNCRRLIEAFDRPVDVFLHDDVQYIVSRKHQHCLRKVTAGEIDVWRRVKKLLASSAPWFANFKLTRAELEVISRELEALGSDKLK
jgi:hypothetical protein